MTTAAGNSPVLRKRRGPLQRSQMFWGYIFVAPAVVGVLGLNLGPMLFSLVISFFEWDVIRAPIFNAGANYKMLFTEPLVLHSLRVSLYFTMLAVPGGNAFALLIALLLNNRRIKMLSVFRTVFYIPSIAPAIASAILWTFMFNPFFGVFNTVFMSLGMNAQGFIADAGQVIPCMAIMSAWASGNAVIIYLAGLQGVPQHLYEAVEVDGGNSWHKLTRITIPMLSPVIFYNLLMAMIGNMQAFTQGYLMTQGGPQNASLFYVLNLYNTAFKNSKMGFASAQAWLMLAVVGTLTLISFWISDRTVYYES